jgi:hypothetical protein
MNRHCNPLAFIPRVVTFIETESGTVAARAGELGNGRVVD